MEQEKELVKWLESSSELVKRNVTVVTPESLGSDTLLHISTNPGIKKFIPHIGHRQARTEDRTIPRITVANSLLGCFIGYAASFYDFTNHASTGKPEDAAYKGGWTIYAIPFKECLKPTPKLVYDAKMSGEHWLVAYSAATSQYVPIKVGRVFYNAIRLVARSGKQPDAFAEMFVEVTNDGIQFSNNIMLRKGYWVIDGPMDYRVASWESDKSFTVREITKDDFMINKTRAAALLNYAEKPAFLGKW
jgi:hypothetical protein